MKIRSVSIRNFKRIKELDINFVDDLTGLVRPTTVLFGDNGSGKTTVLQAIALVISLANWKLLSEREFSWHGFVFDRIDTHGSTKIAVQLEIDDDEIEAVHEVYLRRKQDRDKEKSKVNAHDSIDDYIASPSRNRIMNLTYENGDISYEEDGEEGQLLGRYFLSQIEKLHKKSQRNYLERIGDVFWFDQYRSIGSESLGAKNDTDVLDDLQKGWAAGVFGLREHLIGWWMQKQYASTRNENDFIERLETGFKRVFKDASFGGLEAMPTDHAPKPTDFYFLINRDNTTYDISEMSSGEQAVFSILYNFVRLHISNSIVLIDELELHLHGPEQQMFYHSLRKLGSNNQFIVTSHSSYLADIIPEGSKVRLAGGRLCL